MNREYHLVTVTRYPGSFREKTSTQAIVDSLVAFVAIERELGTSPIVLFSVPITEEQFQLLTRRHT